MLLVGEIMSLCTAREGATTTTSVFDEASGSVQSDRYFTTGSYLKRALEAAEKAYDRWVDITVGKPQRKMSSDGVPPPCKVGEFLHLRPRARRVCLRLLP